MAWKASAEVFCVFLPLDKFCSEANFAFFVNFSFCFFKIICIPFARFVVCIVIKLKYYFFASDFSSFDLSLGLISKLCIPTWFLYLSGFCRYFLGSTCMFSEKILPSNFVWFSANWLSVLVLSAYLLKILFLTSFRCYLMKLLLWI